MTALQPSPTRPHEVRDASGPAVSAERVREMLLEIAFVLHATRVVRRMAEPLVAQPAQPRLAAQLHAGGRKKTDATTTAGSLPA